MKRSTRVGTANSASLSGSASIVDSPCLQYKQYKYIQRLISWRLIVKSKPQGNEVHFSKMAVTWHHRPECPAEDGQATVALIGLIKVPISAAVSALSLVYDDKKLLTRPPCECQVRLEQMRHWQKQRQSSEKLSLLSLMLHLPLQL